MGCDFRTISACFGGTNFNPRTPYGVRHGNAVRHCFFCRFQSTHPVWGATSTNTTTATTAAFQSTHPVWGATLCASIPCTVAENFNPRTPYGVRQTMWDFLEKGGHFNPRTPYGVRRKVVHRPRNRTVISIHAPRMGCDCSAGGLLLGRRHFNPRTPYGVRH